MCLEGARSKEKREREKSLTLVEMEFIHVFNSKATSFHRWAKLFDLNFLQETHSSRRSNLAGKIILRATSSQFVRGKCLSCFLQCATTKVEGFLHLCILHCMCIPINYILINIWNAQYSHVQPGARIKSIMSRSDIEMILNTLFPCCFVGYD